MNERRGRRLLAIGELLIDFSGNRPGTIESVDAFVRHPGGAPANVAVQYARLGGQAKLITKLGEDMFGDFLRSVMEKNGVDCGAIVRTAEAHTGLAFVTLAEDGERDFVFYRHPSADMLLRPEEIDPADFRERDILHFCSVDLVDAPVRAAHDRAIGLAIQRRMLVSFDPNLRFALWPDREELKRIVWTYLPYADVLKVGADEATFLTGGADESSWQTLIRGNVRLLVVTRGPDGATLFTRASRFDVPGIPVETVDTTGAGDSFIAAFLYSLVHSDVDRDRLERDPEALRKALRFANRVASVVVTRYGAIPAMPSFSEVGEPR
ncbi:MAG: carbohydrate kinase [Candidatus Izemoplasmatales bacterium]